MGELHLQKYALIPNVELVGAYEPNEKRANHLRNHYGITVFQNPSELLFEADAVSVTSPTATHFLNCRQALEAGVHVLVEKPMCDNLVQATELIRLARDRKLTLQVGYLERFRLSRLSRMVPLQDLKMIEARWCATQLPRESDIDVVADMFVHPLDLVLSLNHEEPNEIRVRGIPFISSGLDIFEARLEFPSGRVASIFVSRVAHHKERRLSLISTNVVASLNFLTNHIDLVRSVGGEAERASLESSGSDADVLKLQLEDFVDCVQNGKAPLVSAEDGLRVLKTLKLLRESYDLTYARRALQKGDGVAYVT